jgi:hypothetical protein
VDRSAALVEGVNYASGGRVGLPGQTQTDVGTLNATFKDLATPPVVGDLVRLKRTGTSEYAWVGYVQDVSQRIVFDDSVSYTTPVVLTTINCLDWVGYVSQFEAVGVGGLAASTFAVQTSYPYQSRARALNNIVDATNATQLVAFDATSATSIIGDTNMVGTFSDHLDLAARTQNLYWYANNVLPTDKTSGRTGLVTIRPLSTAPSSGKTFTDAVGTSGQLHYTEIDFESSSQNVANTIIVNNSSVITGIPSIGFEVSLIGGGNVPNYNIVNGVEVVSVPYTTTWGQADATSIGTYGNRASQFDTNLAGIVQDLNLCGNPSMEYGDEGWYTGANRMARREPSFGADHGSWALRYRLAANAVSPSFRYSGTENDGVPVIAGTAYMLQARGLRGTPNRGDARARAVIIWQDEAGSNISSVFGAQTTMASLVWTTLTVAGTAPAGAERAIIGVDFNRSGGGQFQAGDQFWLDSVIMRKSGSATPVTYFDGDNASDTSFEYLWTGELGLSPTFKVTNNLDNTASTYLTRYANTSNRITRIRWNAQEDLTAVADLTVGDTTDITFDGTTTTHRIVGIDGNISTTRYMIDYYLEKV